MSRRRGGERWKGDENEGNEQTIEMSLSEQIKVGRPSVLRVVRREAASTTTGRDTLDERAKGESYD